MAKNKKKSIPSKWTTIASLPKPKIPENATKLQGISFDDTKAILSFLYADKTKWKLSSWKNTELDDLISCFQEIESLTWNDIKKSKGLKYGSVHNPPEINNNNISWDVDVKEMRVDRRKRIMGFRVQNIFYIVWFDRDHSVCAEGKNRSHG